MPKKYRIHIEDAPPRFRPVGKFATVEFREDCAGSCRACVKKNCIYSVFEQNQKHISGMAEPVYLYNCESCFRCVQECTRGIFSRVINPEYQTLGDAYWKPDIIHQTWAQAQTGKVPVSGAGYGGPFTGQGFDSMWTDMSEIVRPTRDGIHGREYINTSIELARRPGKLEFNSDGTLGTEPVRVLECPLPLLFQQPQTGRVSRRVLQVMAAAAAGLDTLMLVNPDSYGEDLEPYRSHLVFCLDEGNLAAYAFLTAGSRMVEVADYRGIEQALAALKASNPQLVVSVGLELDRNAVPRALALARMEAVDTLHFYAGADGRELNAENPRFIKDMIRDVHLALVEAALRYRVNLLFSGGIALAEHMAKAVICGADGVTIDRPLLIALECRLCHDCLEGKACPVELEKTPLAWGRQRIINLVGSWHNQLIEVMGAMGIREARRLRGEISRSMWFEDLERENFAPLFGKPKEEGAA